MVLVLWSALACSTTATGNPTAAPSSPRPTPIMPVTTCIGSTVPNDWAAHFQQATVPVPAIQFAAMAVGPGMVFGYYRTGSAQGVARVDLATGSLDVISTLAPEASGLSWMSFADNWLVWTQGDSQTNLGQWSIHAWSLQSRAVLALTTSRLANGLYGSAPLAFPVVGHGYVAWAQPVQQSPLVGELRLYRLDTQQVMTLDSGRLSSPVFWGDNLVWARYATPAATKPTFRMVNADTLASTAPPSDLATPQDILYLAGSPSYLVWSSSQTTLNVKRVGSAGWRTYSIPDNAHVLQFMTLAGHFLLWSGGQSNTVLDLDSAKGFDIPLPSGVAGTDKLLVISRMAAGIKGAISTTYVSSTALSSDLGVHECAP